MDKAHICGIQQIGLGNIDVYKTWAWYRKHLGMDMPMFDEAAEAELMLPYTGGQPRSRHAILALNLMGGGGLEIWQYTNRTPESSSFIIQPGDIGIYSAKYKASDVALVRKRMEEQGVEVLTEVLTEPFGIAHFYAKDLYGNLLEVTESKDWFKKGLSDTGGIYGCSIGVTNMDKAIRFYKDVLGYDKVLARAKGVHPDLGSFTTATDQYERVLLTHSDDRTGPFSKLLGRSELELCKVETRAPKRIFEGRLWGDPGYIHLCFDVVGMDALRQECATHGHPFTVDSGDFDMGEAAGQFAYIEDPDGTLIEFVETHKIPILKKLNWYLDLRKRSRLKVLPKWMLSTLTWNRVKD